MICFQVLCQALCGPRNVVISLSQLAGYHSVMKNLHFLLITPIGMCQKTTFHTLILLNPFAIRTCGDLYTRLPGLGLAAIVRTKAITRDYHLKRELFIQWCSSVVHFPSFSSVRESAKRTRTISQYMYKQNNSPSLHNDQLWIRTNNLIIKTLFNNNGYQAKWDASVFKANKQTVVDERENPAWCEQWF